MTVLAAAKYSIGEKVHHGALVSVYRGTRAEDGAPVVLKRLERPRLNSTDVPRFRREYALARSLAGPGIVTSLDLEEGRDGLTLVMLDRGGESLDRMLRAGKPALAEALRIASAVASALGAVHGRDIIHKDINPANIIMNPRTGGVELIDFGIAAELAREATSPGGQILEGTLSYMAPEQTGRMNRCVDWRADLYALGATLYEMLTGRVPFEGADTLSVVHGHIARAPVPPHRIDPSVPPVVSAIVLKLLAKDPEARYQSAHGLKADLDACLERLEGDGAAALLGLDPDTFVLGRQDRSERFRIPERLYGRETEVSRLLAAYDRICSGPAELLLVAGSAGIGKSALVHEVHKPMAARRGQFVEGKFDQYKRSISYAALIQAFDQLARRVLAEQEAGLAERRAALRAAVGPNGAVITELIPAFELVIGPQPPVAKLGPAEAEFRFQITFQNLVMALATADRPLVLFLDDLQWADRPSLDLLGKLVGDLGLKHLLVIGAYRDGEVPAGHPLHKTVELAVEAGTRVETLTVGPLEEEAVRGLVAETLRRPQAETAPLADACRAKTEGNPFFLAQFLLSLHDDGLIAFDAREGRWRWDQEAVAGHASTANVVELMVSKLQRLPAETQSALSRAACVGNRFDLVTLALAAGEPPAALASALWPALREELVLPVDAAYRYVGESAAPGVERSTDRQAGAEWGGPSDPPLTAGYRFLHDRVQQAAYVLIPEAERAAVHLSIGRLMLKGTDAPERSERLFDLLAQINQGRALIQDEAERLAVARLNLEAAKRAAASAAFEPAKDHAEAAIALVGEEGWGSDYELTLELHEMAVQAASMGSDHAEVDRLAAIVLQRVRQPVQAVRSQIYRVSSIIAQGNNSAATDVALEAAALLGFQVVRKGGPLKNLAAVAQGWWEMVRLHRWPRPPARDAATQALVSELLTIMLMAAYATRRDLWLPNAVRNVRAFLSTGQPGHVLAGIVGWIVVAGVVGARRSAAWWAQRAMGMVRAGTKYERLHRSIAFATYFGRHWTEPLSKMRPEMLDCYHGALHEGDSEGAGYALVTWLRFGWHTGANLSRLETEAQEVMRGVTRIGFLFYGPLIKGFAQAVENLRQGSPEPWRLDGRFLDEDEAVAGLVSANNGIVLAGFYLLKLQLARTFGAARAGRDIAERMTRHMTQIRGSYIQGVYLFERALVETIGPFPTKEARRRAARAMKPTLRWFRKTAALGSANYRHRLLLLEAEYLRLTDRPERAALGYAAAIAAAEAAGYIHEEAVAHERAGDFCASLGYGAQALFHRSQARDIYRRWEAWAKVGEMERRFPELAVLPQGEGRQPTRKSTSTSRFNTVSLDTEAVLKAAQAISGEIQREALLERLLRTVLEVAGAQRGLLLLAEAPAAGTDGRLRIAAEGNGADDAYHALPGLDPAAPAEDGGPRLPLSVIAYASRVREPVVLGEAAADARFAGDPYMTARRPLSVLCLPLVRKAELVGLLYLENNLVTDAFVDQRLEAPRLLAAQIAISLENARLYDELADFNRGLEAQIADRTRALSEQSEVLRRTLGEVSEAHARLQQTQQQLVQSEKMAALGSLVAGVAHEINTPLGVALTAASHLSDETRRIARLVEEGKLKRSEFAEYSEMTLDSTGLLLANIGRAADLVHGFKQVAADQTSDERREFTLDEWLEDLVHSLRPMWHRPGHSLTVDCPPGLTLDNHPGALAQILTNLISNTLVHGFEPERTGRIAIAVTALESEPGPESVEIVYTDDGAGIAPEHLPTLFDPFFTTRRSQGSTGLGLHIVYNLVAQRLGGTIRVDSRPGEGVRFTLRLPRAAP
ncbi:ATP-binding sensor histidine kinase [Azospirillum sp. SYSU D00513]|uniref:trifunctional serine/threonine-protein kinase/ATP-binding protein/sensor histidine kinase n=1 Tax=Azospirillum sp. SYSU D00513 TaxID=2812561 RepID=UPI001A9671A6|nr:ATP-binding sensor histidine kinase [Azospirillum sp. SYSU D00513]